MGNRAAADEYAKPMEQGRMRFCPDTPHLYWLAYLEDALDRGDLREAEKLANWFREQAETISRHFDERNGSHCFGHDLAVALAKR